MKKNLLKTAGIFIVTALLSMQGFNVSAKASKTVQANVNKSVFSYDQNALNSEMSQLNALDNYVNANKGTTYADLANEGSPLVANVASSASPMGVDTDDALLGIPPFLWGCVLGVVGILLVYILTDGDKGQTTKALWGCLAWGVAWFAFYFLYYAIWGYYWW